MTARRLYLAVGAAAAIVYLAVLWNGFALDDVTIIFANPLVHQLSGVWRAFAAPYFPPNLDTSVYRPLVVATYALDWLTGSTVWFHVVNLAWHVAASVLVAVLGRRWAGEAAGLVAGIVFAVHPVHVEAVANVVGRNELMAAVFTLLALYAALERESVLLSAAALAAGLLSKENAAVAPGLVVGAWLLGVRPVPPPRKLAAFAASWLVLAGSYVAIRWTVLHGFGGRNVAAAFLGQDPSTIRLTAVAALADVARLLLFPLALSADYSPDERTAVHTLLDVRFVVGFLVLTLWALLLGEAWRRKQVRGVEALGLGWIAVAYAPVANLLFPVQIIVAERTLYLPSAGLALATGALLRRLTGRGLAAVVGLVFVLGGVRTALRVPAWRDDHAAALALLHDAPRSYFTWQNLGWQYLRLGQFAKALEAFQVSSRIYPRDARVYLAAAHAAYALDRAATADSLLTRADAACERCVTYYRNQAWFARLRGDSGVADSLLAHAHRLRPS